MNRLNNPDNAIVPVDSSEYMTAPPVPWYVLWTRSHSERLVVDQLEARGYQLLLPMIDVWTRRGGVRQRASLPMFPGYVFLHHQIDKASYIEVSRARGLVRILGESWDNLTPVPDAQIEAVQKVHAAKVPAHPHPYLKEGERVRIKSGLLAGAEGILLRMKLNKGLLVVSVDLLQRSVAVEIDCTLVAPA